MDTYEQHGFIRIGTGGNCTAFQRDVAPDLGVKWYVLVTVRDEPIAPESFNEPVTVSIYREDNGDEVADPVDVTNGWEALHVAGVLAREVMHKANIRRQLGEVV